MINKKISKKRVGTKKWKSKKRKHVLRGGEGGDNEATIDGTMVCPIDEMTPIKTENKSTKLTLNKSINTPKLKEEYDDFLNKIIDSIIKNIVDNSIDDETNTEIFDEIYEKWMYENYVQEIYNKFTDFLGDKKKKFDVKCYNYIYNNILFIYNVLGQKFFTKIYKDKTHFQNEYKSNKDTLKKSGFNLILNQFSILMAKFQKKIYTNLKITKEGMVTNESCFTLMTNDVKKIFYCPDKLNCSNPNCKLIHPRGFKKPCKFGKNCIYKNTTCTYRHPEKSNNNKTDKT